MSCPVKDCSRWKKNCDDFQPIGKGGNGFYFYKNEKVYAGNPVDNLGDLTVKLGEVLREQC